MGAISARRTAADLHGVVARWGLRGVEEVAHPEPVLPAEPHRQDGLRRGWLSATDGYQPRMAAAGAAGAAGAHRVDPPGLREVASLCAGRRAVGRLLGRPAGCQGSREMVQPRGSMADGATARRGTRVPPGLPRHDGRAAAGEGEERRRQPGH
jgi:hypothetical protein